MTPVIRKPGLLSIFLFCVSLLTATSSGAGPPIEAFARLPAMRGVSISPDGQYIAYLTAVHGRPALATVERTQGGKLRIVLTNDKSDDFTIDRCGWANATRLLCSLRGVRIDPGQRTVDLFGGTYYVTRLVAVNVDGGDMKVLVKDTPTREAQFQEVVDWTPDEPNSVLLQMVSGRDVYPSIFELDVYSGNLHIHTYGHPPILNFRTDEKGVARLGWGLQQTNVSYFARLSNDTEWHKLAQFEAFSQSHFPQPIAIIPGTNQVYATGLNDGRDALWELDLEEKVPPKLLAEHPRVDVNTPLLDSDGRLLGIYYETDRPAVYYTDARAKRISELVQPLLPDAFIRVVDATRDKKVSIIETTSDVDAGTYYLLDVGGGEGKLQKIGTAYPELDTATLGRMQSIEYPAADGTLIPGYLTVAPGVAAHGLPLIVNPHGGPIARTSWEFNFLDQFLVSRGYAVLEMNFRGSSGYGLSWLHAAHQDWGGLTYSDILDGARWAIAQGIADPQRICIVGWSFGGYAALLGATRNSDVFRCAVSIAGVSDLAELESEARRFLNGKIAKLQVGTDAEKLRADSPRRHADGVAIPLLLVHGTHDVTVNVDQSQLMVDALEHAGKHYEYVEIKDADHQLWREAERMTMLKAVEKFLAQNLGGTHGGSD